MDKYICLAQQRRDVIILPLIAFLPKMLCRHLKVSHGLDTSNSVTSNRLWAFADSRYHGRMDKQEHLKRHLALCKRIYLRMLEDNSWPWRDSPKSEDLVESKDIRREL